MRPHVAHRRLAAIGKIGAAQIVHEPSGRAIDHLEPLQTLENRRRDIATMLDPHPVIGARVGCEARLDTEQIDEIRSHYAPTRLGVTYYQKLVG